MNLYSAYDYLCNEPYYIEGIGNVRCPTLRDIRKVTYNHFSLFSNILSMTLETYVDTVGLTEAFQALDEEQRSKYSIFYLMLFGNTQLLLSMLKLFIVDSIKLNEETNEFITYNVDENGKENNVGIICNENFDTLRNEIQCILGIKEPAEKEQKFKNEYARKMYEQFKQHAQKQKKESDENFAFDNMIKKYCTHNKVGINILNVWDMTYYQFVTMFKEYGNGRQHDFSDMMAANTFSYKKYTDYKAMDYMKKIE